LVTWTVNLIYNLTALFFFQAEMSYDLNVNCVGVETKFNPIAYCSSDKIYTCEIVRIFVDLDQGSIKYNLFEGYLKSLGQPATF
jgi:hypothetical protein